MEEEYAERRCNKCHRVLAMAMFRAPNGSVRKCCAQCISRALVVRRAKFNSKAKEANSSRGLDLKAIFDMYDQLPVDTIQEAILKTKEYLHRRMYGESLATDPEPSVSM